VRCLKLLIAYDGTAYCGWQRQLRDPTIQGVVEDCLGAMTQETVTVHGAGRTDAGVHAYGMVASFITHSSINCQSFLKGLNSLLPSDIRIRMVEDVAIEFHARFSCTGKRYCYQFSCRPILLPTERLYWAHFPGVFTESVARHCLDLLVGEHDFSSFEAAGSRDLNRVGGRGAVRTIYKVELEKTSNLDLYSITIAGDGFLRHMVRNIAGTVIETAQAKRTLAEFTEILAAKDRSVAGLTAPAKGLFLKEVFY